MTVGGARVAALIKDIREYKHRNQERESVKVFGYHNLNGTAASAPVKRTKQYGGSGG